MTKKKNISSSSVLVQLYNNRKLATKVDNMLDEGQTYEYIISFCKENGLSISKASLTNYKKKREEALKTGKPLLQLLDKRAKDNVTYITNKEVQAFKAKKKDTTKDSDPDSAASTAATITDINKVDKVFNDLEFLDEIITKGAKGLKAFDVVDTPLAMKAIELKAKITNNQLSGLSIAGLRELKLRMTCKESGTRSLPSGRGQEVFRKRKLRTYCPRGSRPLCPRGPCRTASGAVQVPWLDLHPDACRGTHL